MEDESQQMATKARASYLTALVAEIRILIRAIASNPNRSLVDFKVVWREKDKEDVIQYPRVVQLLVSWFVTDSFV
jgi:hypothetical protein